MTQKTDSEKSAPQRKKLGDFGINPKPGTYKKVDEPTTGQYPLNMGTINWR